MFFRLPRRRTFVWLALFIVIATFLWLDHSSTSAGIATEAGKYGRSGTRMPSQRELEKRRKAVKEAFSSTWDAYKKHAWGQDQYHPVSREGSQSSPDGLGWMIIDGLDTMMIMNMTEEVAQSRRWIWGHDYDQDQSVKTCETMNRMVGGLLSAHFLASTLPNLWVREDEIYLKRAIDLADRLLSAFQATSGIPYASVGLKSFKAIESSANGGALPAAEVASIQLELKYLAQLTNKHGYWTKAERIMKVIDDNQMRDGLLPSSINPKDGRFRGDEIRLGSNGESYYEYLVKQWLQTGEGYYNEMWLESLAGIKQHLITTSEHARLVFVAELPKGIGQSLTPKMDHLVCSLPATIAMAATAGRPVAEARKWSDWTAAKEQQIVLAAELMKTCRAMYEVTETGLAPETAYFSALKAQLQPEPGNQLSDLARLGWKSSNDRNRWKQDLLIIPQDAHNLQRPETIESLFVMYRLTEDPIYIEWAWKMFQAFQKHTLVEGGEGYSSIGNVNAVPPPMRDNVESYWLAGTLKYFYLIFSPSDFLPLTEVVFNTEAHIFPRLKEPKYKTGWTRKKYRRNRAR